MARPKRIVHQEDTIMEDPIPTPIPTPTPIIPIVASIKEYNLTLPNKDLFRIEEVAEYFSVTTRCIYLWAENGHLEIEKINGIARIPRASILKCRFKPKEEIIQD